MLSTILYFSPFRYLLPSYVKKENAKDMVKQLRKIISLVVFALACTLAVMQFVISPRIVQIYSDFQMSMPFMMQASLYISLAIIAACVFVSFYFFLTPPDYARLTKVLAKYKTGEMIMVTQLIHPIYLLVIYALLTLVVGSIILTNIVPLYSLSKMEF